MTTRIFLTVLSGMALGLAMISVGCSSDQGNKTKNESLADRVVEDFVETTFADIQVEDVEAEFSDEAVVSGNGTMVFDMVVRDNLIYALTADGLILHNLATGNNMIIDTETPVGAIADLGDKIVLGGDNLYTLEGDFLSDSGCQLKLDGPITVLYRHKMNLMIGTTGGLYELSTAGIRPLASDIYVSALVSEGNALWVGTAGQGLYRWDGVSFRKRYLKRDSTLFDHVTALDYSHNHLYLGTDRGFYTHDGGSWKPYNLADGLPSETITAINADDWVVKIGTTRGAVTFFNNEFKPIPHLTGLAVNRFLTRDNKMLAATAQGGLIMKSGGLFTVLYDGQATTLEIAVEDSW